MRFGRVAMDGSMVRSRWCPLLVVLCFVSSSSLLVRSQTSSDSCAAALSVGSLLPFNTTGLKCLQAWPSQDFVLRFGKDASGSNVWNFVLSAPDTGGYIAVGFSPSGKMVGSSAVAGWVPAGKAGTARQYYLGGMSSSSCPPDQGKLTLSRGPAAPAIVSKSSRLYLAFQFSGQPLTKVIYAVGPKGTLPDSNGLLAVHLAMATGSISLSGGAAGTPATGSSGEGDEGSEGSEGGEGKGKSDHSGAAGESGSDGKATTTTTASATSSSAGVPRAQWTKCGQFVQILTYFAFFSVKILF